MDEVESRHISYRTSSEILDNAFDFLSTSTTILSKFSGWMKYLGEAEAKTSLISVTTSVELILKSKIASIDWKEIFDKPSNANVLKLKAGDFKSVSFEDCVPRIEKLTGQKISVSLAQKIESIRKIRNQLIHFHFKMNQESYATTISKGVAVFIEFYRQHIKEDFCEEKDRTKEWEKEIFGVDEYIKVKMEILLPKLQKADRPKTYYFSYCTTCDQDTLIRKNKTTVKCVFCEAEEDIETFAELVTENIQLNQRCEICDIKTIVALRKLKPDEKQSLECIVCGLHTIRPQKWLLSEDKVSENSIRTDFSPGLYNKII